MKIALVVAIAVALISAPVLALHEGTPHLGPTIVNSDLPKQDDPTDERLIWFEAPWFFSTTFDGTLALAVLLLIRTLRRRRVRPRT